MFPRSETLWIIFSKTPTNPSLGLNIQRLLLVCFSLWKFYTKLDPFVSVGYVSQWFKFLNFQVFVQSDTRYFRLVTFWILRSSKFQIHKFLNFQIFSVPCLYISKFSNFRTLGKVSSLRISAFNFDKYSFIRIFSVSNFQISRSPDSQIFALSNFQVLKCLNCVISTCCMYHLVTKMKLDEATAKSINRSWNRA